MRPSDPTLSHVLSDASGVYLFAERRFFGPRFSARVKRVQGHWVELRLDPDDLREAKLKVADEVVLSVPVAAQQTHFGAAVKVLDLDAHGRLWVSQPHHLQKWPCRSAVRARLAVPCELVLASPATPAPLTVRGTTADVSASGAAIELDGSVSADAIKEARGSIRLRFPDRMPIESPCRVARLIHPRHAGDSRVSALAVHYEDLPEQDEMQIHLLALRATARRFFRADAAVTCQLRQVGTGAFWEGVTKNISASGLLARFRGLVSLSPRDRVSVELRLISRHIAAPEAQVVRVEQQGDHGLVAIDLGELSEFDRESLIRFVVDQIRGVDQGAPPLSEPPTERAAPR